MGKKNSNRNTNNVKTKYKRSFWKMHKWTIILISIPISFIILSALVLILYAKIFDNYQKTSIISFNYSDFGTAGSFVYVVDGIEYYASYDIGKLGLDADHPYQGNSKSIWYSVSNPQNYIFNRDACIIGFSLLVVGATTMIIIFVTQKLLRQNKRKKAKKSR